MHDNAQRRHQRHVHARLNEDMIFSLQLERLLLDLRYYLTSRLVGNLGLILEEVDR